MTEYTGSFLPLPPGENFLGRHRLDDDNTLIRPPRWRRPVAFRGHRESRGRLLAFVLEPWSIFDGFSDRMGGDQVQRWINKRREPKPPKSKGWTSTGGRLGAAMNPRTRVNVGFSLELTDQRLMLLYTRRPKTGERPEACLQAAWEVRLDHIAWIRSRADGPKLYEFGFQDGSWMSLSFWDPGYSLYVSEIRTAMGQGQATQNK